VRGEEKKKGPDRGLSHKRTANCFCVNVVGGGKRGPKKGHIVRDKRGPPIRKKENPTAPVPEKREEKKRGETRFRRLLRLALRKFIEEGRRGEGVRCHNIGHLVIRKRRRAISHCRGIPRTERGKKGVPDDAISAG